MKTLILTAAALSFAVQAASAADLPSRRLPPVVPLPPVAPWGGFYGGINAGANITSSNSISTLTTPIFNAGVAGAPALAVANEAGSTNGFGVGSKTSAIVGGQVGYNFLYGRQLVVGIETDIDAILSGSQAAGLVSVQPIAGFPANTVVSTNVLSKRIDDVGTTRGRIGYLFTPNFLVFATGGVAYGSVRSSTAISDTLTGPNGIVTPYTYNNAQFRTKVGYAVGGGVEYMLGNQFSIKAEYVYYDLGTSTYNGQLVSNAIAAAPFTIDNVQTRARFAGQFVRLGLNYHLDLAPAPVVAKY